MWLYIKLWKLKQESVMNGSYMDTMILQLNYAHKVAKSASLAGILHNELWLQTSLWLMITNWIQHVNNYNISEMESHNIAYVLNYRPASFIGQLDINYRFVHTRSINGP